jgi:hypothetical protein
MVALPYDPTLPQAAGATPPEPEAEPAPPPTLGDLYGRIRDLEARVESLEALRGESPATVRAGAVPAESGPQAGQEPAAPGAGVVLALLGRTCLVLGGAFLLRALTEGGALPARGGVALGLAYSAAWAGSAHRSGTRGHRAWAAFQVFAAAAVAYPLLWETTVRLGLVPPGFASAAVLLWTLGLAAVAIRHDLRRAAWITVLGALAAGFAIMAATSAVAEFSPFFILASAASLLLTGREDWRALRWPAALGADLAILSMVLLTLSPGGSEALARDLRPGPVLAAALAFVAVHLGAFLARTLLRPRAAGPFELFQTAAVLGVGLLGAVEIAQATGQGRAATGAVALGFGVAGYLSGFAFAGRRTEGSLDFKYVTTLGLVLTVAGGLLLLGPGALALGCLAAGTATTFLGVRASRFSLQFHGLAYLGAAAALSGLITGTVSAFLGGGGDLAAFPPRACLVIPFLAAAHVYPVDRRGAPGLPWRLRVPSLGFAALALFALGGLAVAAAGLREPAVLAVLRTAVLVAMALGSAAAARWKPASELAWLAYPALGGAALEAALGVLPGGRPALMFLAISLVGAGLLAVPRLLRAR